MSAKQCRRCLLLNPETAVVCRCGNPLTESDAPDRAAPRAVTAGWAIVALLLVAGLIAVGVHGLAGEGRPVGRAWTPYLFIGAGLFSAAGGLRGWSWFMNSRKARFFTSILGETGARVFYALLGAALAGAGLGLLPWS